MNIARLFYSVAENLCLVLFAFWLLFYRVMVFDLGDAGKRYFHDLATGALDLHARRSQRLSHLHAAHGAAHSLAVKGYDLNVVFSLQRLHRRQRFGYFHF